MITPEMISDAKSGNANALLAEMEPRIQRAVRKFGPDAPDLAQEARVAVWESIGVLRSEEPAPCAAYLGIIIDSAVRTSRLNARGVGIGVAHIFSRALAQSEGDVDAAFELSQRKDVFGEKRLSRNAAEDAREAWRWTTSLDTPFGERESTLYDVLPMGAHRETPENQHAIEQVKRTLLNLGPSKRKILILAYGLGGNAPLSDEEIAQRMGTRVRTVQNERARAKRQFAMYFRP
ncbi:hypothetical protein [Streptomyces sp. NPDC020917]|uniref:hypothetical protein n=1 Tax=Streptomyces sp. NPDC020917 TaxID=3365102 RepID=UPI0037AAD40E